MLAARTSGLSEYLAQTMAGVMIPQNYEEESLVWTGLEWVEPVWMELV